MPRHDGDGRGWAMSKHDVSEPYARLAVVGSAVKRWGFDDCLLGRCKGSYAFLGGRIDDIIEL